MGRPSREPTSCNLNGCQTSCEQQRTCIGLLAVLCHVELLDQVQEAHKQLSEDETHGDAWQHNPRPQLTGDQSKAYMKQVSKLPKCCMGSAASCASSSGLLSWHEGCLPQLRAGVSPSDHQVMTSCSKGWPGHLSVKTLRARAALLQLACPWCTAAIGESAVADVAMQPGACFESLYPSPARKLRRWSSLNNMPRLAHRNCSCGDAAPT